MEYRHIRYSRENGIARIVLDRPDVLNALNRAMADEILDAVRVIAADESARALVIWGSGSNFAAGADVGSMVDLTPAEVPAFAYNDAFNALEDLPVPTIAALSGFVLGGGLELALACDFRICSRDAKLGSPEIKLGIFPGAGATQRLPKLIGPSRAKEMIFLGKSVDAETALRYGLCDRVAEGDPVTEALEMAAQLARQAPAAIRIAKGVINYGLGRDIKIGVAFEEKGFAELFTTADQKEGMKAFLEKRKPVFTGK
ncbi:MAG: enoyl-CoA hydratase/isomerase family protein [Spirochaetes bacterium]|nr:enoyl-CoA hydratase/isomerase family protein [Spirochaetota bacterium]